MPASGARTFLATVLACSAGLAVNLWMAANNSGAFGVDFNQFYSASRLAGTGNLYDWDALRKLEAAHGGPVRTGRLPVVAYGMKLIGWMPYSTAHAVWVAASVAALVLFALAWPGLNRRLAAMALCWSLPVALSLMLGQDLPFWLMFAAAGFLWLSRGRPRLAGAVMTLCICKFHLAAGLPVLLAAQKRWSALMAASVAGAALVGACFWIEGPAWPLRYREAITQPLFSPAIPRMANLRGIAWWLPWSGAVEAVLAIALVGLLWHFCRRVRQPGLAAAGAAAAGMLLGRHGQASDFALLIPLLVFTLQRPGVPPWLKYWAVLLLTPLPTLLVVTSKPFLGQIALVGFVVAALVRECPIRETAVDGPHALPA